jgi:hypothetical protein
MHDVIIPEADHAVATARDLDNIRSDRMLPPKAMLGRKLAQSQPHLFLGFRRSPPELPSNPGPPLQRQAMVPISLSAP